MNNNIGALKQGIKDDNDKNAWTCHYAAYYGNLEALKLLRVNNYPWDAYTCIGAITGKHFQVLKWVVKNGCPCNKWVCLEAAQHGDLEALKWLRNNECSVYVYDKDAKSELKWLKSCPWDKPLCERESVKFPKTHWWIQIYLSEQI